jgi:dTMP kinase
MNVNKGHCVVVEGLEGAGKSSAINAIKQFLENLKLKVVLTREPGGTRVGETIRHLIKEKTVAEHLDSRAELLLMYASRVQLLEHVIKPALNLGSWVVADRFELSTWAYQGGGRKLDKEMISHLSNFCLKDFKPDLVIFLDIRPEKGLERALHRGKFDRIEQESLDFFNDVYNGYHEQIKTMNNVVVIDASLPLAVVRKSIMTALKNYMQIL